MISEISHGGGCYFSFAAGCPLRGGMAAARLLLGRHQTAAWLGPRAQPDMAPPRASGGRARCEARQPTVPG